MGTIVHVQSAYRMLSPKFRKEEKQQATTREIYVKRCYSYAPLFRFPSHHNEIQKIEHSRVQLRGESYIVTLCLHVTVIVQLHCEKSDIHGCIVTFFLQDNFQIYNLIVLASSILLSIRISVIVFSWSYITVACSLQFIYQNA